MAVTPAGEQPLRDQAEATAAAPTEHDQNAVTGLSVYAQGVYPVQLVCQTPDGLRRIDVHARVDVSTGRVEFYVPPDQIDRLR